MKFPFDLLKSKTPVLNNLSTADRKSKYIACFGNTKHLELLVQFTELETLWLSGVNDKQLSKVSELTSIETLIIHDLRTSDLSQLVKFPSVKTLLIWGNTKATSLFGLTNLSRLSILGLEHFPKIRDVKEISDINNLKMLCLTGSVDTALKIESLSPLGILKQLKLLHITNLRVSDESLDFITQLKELVELQVSNQFPTQEYAKLKGKCGYLRCTHFSPFISSSIKCEICGCAQVMVVGKRKPFICPSCKPDRLKKYQADFEALVARAT